MRETTPDRIADIICLNVAELPDRTSPEDWPEAMLVTQAELQGIVTDALSDLLADREQAAQEIQRLQVEGIRKLIMGTVKGFAAGENTDAKAWRKRAEKAEQQLADAERVTAALRTQIKWQPIETAPERRKLIVTWVNALGKRRTTFAVYYPLGTLDMDDDAPEEWIDEEGRNAIAGWWECAEAGDSPDQYLGESLTHWMSVDALDVLA